jgi:hypothetical protein
MLFQAIRQICSIYQQAVLIRIVVNSSNKLVSLNDLLYATSLISGKRPVTWRHYK